MNIWFLLSGAFIVQELVSTNAALLVAYQQGYNPWLIHLLFLAFTIFDISVGYSLGTWISRDMLSEKVRDRITRYIDFIEGLVGSFGKKVALMLLSILGFPYVNGFIAAWLDLSLAEAILYLLPGSIIWYGVEWSVILGVHFLFPNPLTALSIVLGISLLLIILIRFFTKDTFRRF